MTALTLATIPVDKRPMGSGTIERRGDKFRARLRIAGKRRDLGTYTDEDIAKGVLQAALDAIEARQLSPASSVTLRAYGTGWITEREEAGLLRSSDNEWSRWRAHIESAPFIDDPIDRIERRAVRRHLLSLLGKRVSVHVGNGVTRAGARKLDRSTVAQVLSTLRNCFAAALDDELIDVNPAAGIKLPKALRTRDPWTFLTLPEIDQLLSCAAIPEPIRLLYAAAIYTGLRKGELWGLRWGDVYLTEQPHLMVRRSHKSAPKNGKPGMTPLIPRALEVFDRLRVLAGGDPGPDALVFPAADGCQRTRGDDARWRSRMLSRVDASGERIRTMLPGYAERAGIARHVRFHDLRHTCASHLISGSWGKFWPIEQVSAFLRHSNPSQTARYAHLAPGAIHAAAAATGGPNVAPALSAGARKKLESLSKLTKAGTHALVPVRRSHAQQYRMVGPAGDQSGASFDELLAQAVAMLRAVAAGGVDLGAVDAFLRTLGGAATEALGTADERLRVRRATEIAAGLLDAAAVHPLVGRRGRA